jgi:hypothetical protein
LSERPNFKQALLEAVDDGLLTLGESGRKAVYFHLQNLYSLKREDIADKPELFAEGLRKIFGIGATVIEKATLRSLYQKLGIKYEENKGHDFLAYLNDAMRFVEK